MSAGEGLCQRKGHLSKGIYHYWRSGFQKRDGNSGEQLIPTGHTVFYTLRVDALRAIRYAILINFPAFIRTVKNFMIPWQQTMFCLLPFVFQNIEAEGTPYGDDSLLF